MGTRGRVDTSPAAQGCPRGLKLRVQYESHTLLEGMDLRESVMEPCSFNVRVNCPIIVLAMQFDQPIHLRGYVLGRAVLVDSSGAPWVVGHPLVATLFKVAIKCLVELIENNN